MSRLIFILTVCESFFVVITLALINVRAVDLANSPGSWEQIIASTLEQNRSLKRQLEQANLFRNALLSIDPKDYDRKNNNCYDHSKRLQKQLASMGIKSSIFINENRNHAWSCVWVESTSGRFIPPTTPLRPIEVRDENLNVILEK